MKKDNELNPLIKSITDSFDALQQRMDIISERVDVVSDFTRKQTSTLAKEVFSEKETKYQNIEIPITEEDIRMFQELVCNERDSFSWTFDNINVEFIKGEGDE
jgi:hypothetical protein